MNEIKPNCKGYCSEVHLVKAYNGKGWRVWMCSKCNQKFEIKDGQTAKSASTVTILSKGAMPV